MRLSSGSVVYGIWIVIIIFILESNYSVQVIAEYKLLVASSKWSNNYFSIYEHRDSEAVAILVDHGSYYVFGNYILQNLRKLFTKYNYSDN